MDIKQGFTPIKPQAAEAVLEVKDPVLLASEWLGKQLRSVRVWKGSDERQYASISHTGANPNNGVHNDPLDVAEALLKMKTGSREFITFSLKFNGTTSVARLIKADRTNNKLIVALDMEYGVSAVSASVTGFQQKKAVEGQIEMGFGAF